MLLVWEVVLVALGNHQTQLYLLMRGTGRSWGIPGEVCHSECPPGRSTWSTSC